MDHTTGICKLVFRPDSSDLGQWTCRFTVNNENDDEDDNVEFELGSASLVLLSTLAGLLTLRNVDNRSVFLTSHSFSV